MEAVCGKMRLPSERTWISYTEAIAIYPKLRIVHSVHNLHFDLQHLLLQQ